jgi:hypothetical protein
MKTLRDYIAESHGDMSSSKNIVFNFSKLTDGEQKKKELMDLCTSDFINFAEADNKLTITITKDQAEKNKLSNVYDFLNDYATSLRKEIKNASDESYAQITKKFKINVDSINEFIESIKNDTEEIKKQTTDNEQNKKEEE